MRAALLCLSVMLLAAAVCQAIGPGSCECLKTSKTVLRISNIFYYVQKSGLCAIDAVVFTAVKGVKICSDPQKPLVKRAMKAVDGRRTTISSKAVPATTAFNPTRNTTDQLYHRENSKEDIPEKTGSEEADAIPTSIDLLEWVAGAGCVGYRDIRNISSSHPFYSTRSVFFGYIPNTGNCIRFDGKPTQRNLLPAED
ncbi:hypothetical protein AOLI_G00259140 [Acnodon oligacanthus]